MNKELQQKFGELFINVINTDNQKVELIENPKPKTLTGNGIKFDFCFDTGYNFIVKGKKKHLAFYYSKTNTFVTAEECERWHMILSALKDSYVILVTDVGFTQRALDFVVHHRLRIDNRLILAKYTGSSESKFLMHRISYPPTDPKERMGELSGNEDCSYPLFVRGDVLCEPLGLLDDLGVPLKTKYQLRCPYVKKEYIQSKVDEALKMAEIDERNILWQPNFLFEIAKAANVKIEFLDMGEEVLGEYDCKNTVIRMNGRTFSATDLTPRGRFTLAHELGHFFLHQDISRQYDFRFTDDTSCLNYAIPSNDCKRMEYQANSFAAFLLMPAKIVEKHGVALMIEMGFTKNIVWGDSQYSLTEGKFNQDKANTYVRRIANLFHVSFEMAKYQLENVGLYKEEKSNLENLSTLTDECYKNIRANKIGH